MLSSAPRLLGANLGQDLVTIYVGKKRKEFIIHEKLICDKAEFFLKAFTGPFQERNGVMHLPDEDPGSFSLFVDWVYRSTVPHCNTRDHFVNLFKLYVFAEKMYSNELANRTMDRIRFTEYHNPKARVTVPLTCYVYKNTPEDSPLRQYCIHDLAYNLWNAKIESTIPDNHNLRPILECSQTQNDMVLDFFGFLRNNPTGIDNHTEDSDLSGKECEFFFCNFHRHGVKEICYTARSAVDSQNWPKGQSMDDFGDFSY